jgi:hypothetical protein
MWRLSPMDLAVTYILSIALCQLGASLIKAIRCGRCYRVLIIQPAPSPRCGSWVKRQNVLHAATSDIGLHCGATIQFIGSTCD